MLFNNINIFLYYIFLNIKGIFLVRIGKVLIIPVLCDIKLVTQEGPYSTKLQDTLLAIHDCKLIAAHKVLASLLVVEAIGPALSSCVGCVVKVDRFLSKRLRQFLQGAAFFASKEKHAVMR